MPAFARREGNNIPAIPVGMKKKQSPRVNRLVWKIAAVKGVRRRGRAQCRRDRARAGGWRKLRDLDVRVAQRYQAQDVDLPGLAGRVGLDAGCGKGRFTRVLARHLADQYHAKSVKLYLQRHYVPRMSEVRQGMRLNDKILYQDLHDGRPVAVYEREAS